MQKKSIKSNSYFICGTDTGVGKTVVCAGLLKNITNAHALKVIQTGDSLLDQNVYIEAHNRASVRTIKHFELAASPHLAASLTGVTLSVNELSSEIEKEIVQHEFNLIECCGGLLTPINDKETFLDLIVSLSFPVILVVKNGLGAINHCLLSINTLRQHGVEIAGLIFTHPQPFATSEQTVIAQDNIKILNERTKLPVLASIPFIPELLATKNRQSGWEKVANALENTAYELQKNPSQMSSNFLSDFDQQHLWHPYVRAIDAPLNPIVEQTKGCYFYLKDGRQILDGMSSWWSAIHGYNHPVLLKAISQQATKMPHIMFGGLTHEPAILLGQCLLEIAPKGLNNIFYADSGSVAVEVALKMAIQYYHSKGLRGKSKFISFLGGYHGDTFGAMSVCDPVQGMHNAFGEMLLKNIFVSRPNISFNQTFDPSALDKFRQVIAQHHHECAAVIIEPIVQAAGGMWIYHPQFLKEIRKICSENQILLIVDEIATGFGRTGQLFACDWSQITPDIMCIGKALTGGCMTLAATMSTKEVAIGISEQNNVLMHGPTFMANPLACHIALASIDLLLKSSWQKIINSIEKILKTELTVCLEDCMVADVRVLGAIGVIEMKEKVDAAKLQRYFIDQHRVWIRPFNNLIYVMPAFVIQPEEVLLLTKAIKQAIVEKAWN